MGMFDLIIVYFDGKGIPRKKEIMGYHTQAQRNIFKRSLRNEKEH